MLDVGIFSRIMKVLKHPTILLLEDLRERAFGEVVCTCEQR